ncbi:hypothetical protein K438DRAFT_1827503 [Mycena galopus ATCC 62051]|nr:hypothetical protein K438DRAFT_1827503 [Mycena galopus ATCC 62051]
MLVSIVVHAHPSCTLTLLADPCPSHLRPSRKLVAYASPSCTYILLAHATPPHSCAPIPVARKFVVVHPHSRPSQARIVLHERGASPPSSSSQRELLAPTPSRLYPST